MTAHRSRPPPANPPRRVGGGVRHVVPPIELQERVRAFVTAYGTPRARVLLGGVSGETLARVCAGLRISRGSVSIMTRALEERDEAARARGEDGLA